MNKPASSGHTAWIGAAAVIAIAIGAFFAWPKKVEPPSAAPTVPAPQPAAPVASTPPAIQHPIEQAQNGEPVAEPAAPLPTLELSDAAVLEALGAIVGGGDALASLLYPEHVIPRVVATIDSLPRRQVAPQIMPLHPAPGLLGVVGLEPHRAIDPTNAARYAPYVKLAQAADAKALVTWYRHQYPLFQQAYRELGYPDGYFNDRLVAAIDDMLATPDVSQPLELTQPNVVYEFADPTLEARSAGQKILLRAGPANAAILKAKLREVRRELTGRETP